MSQNFRPYYAVIFTSKLTRSTEGYDEMASEMEDLASKQPGYLGFESARSGLGISISYWKSLDDIRSWKSHVDHLKAQKLGRSKWYESYKVKICKIEREYSFESS